MQQPIIHTKRLRLRQMTQIDASTVQQLAGASEVAAMTRTIPHPYLDGMAEQWISGHNLFFVSGNGIVFAITCINTNILYGAIELTIHQEDRNAELSCWIGLPFWSHGYATEAARAVVQYGFEVLQLHRIYATHFKQNSGSRRVIQKIGMIYEGELRHHVHKENRFEDVVCYGLLKDEWQQRIPQLDEGKVNL